VPTTRLTPNAKQQFFDANGNPLAGGKLYTYAGGTTTLLATYTDSTGATSNANPIILDSRGEANVWLAINTSYKFKLTDANDVQIWVVDEVSSPSGTVTSVGLTAPALFTVTGSPVTGAGTLDLAYSGTALPAANGGTGLTSPGASGNVLVSNGTAWVSSSSGAVSSISFGSTGLTPSTATGGAVTVAGTLVAGNGGTGLSSPGTAGNVLTSNGTIWTSAAPSSGAGIVFISTLTASASATIDFTDLSTYKKYLIIFENIFPSSSGGPTFSVRFGTGSTPTYLTSNYAFQYSGVTSGSSSSADRITLGSGLVASSYPGMSGSLFVEGMLSSYTSVQGLFYYTDGTSGSQYSTLVSSGTNYTSTAAKTALRFLPGSGTITSGTFSLYGITS
jgi:hypothetical protein